MRTRTRKKSCSFSILPDYVDMLDDYIKTLPFPTTRSMTFERIITEWIDKNIAIEEKKIAY